MELLIGFLNLVTPLSEESKIYLRANVKHTSLKKYQIVLKPGQISRNIYFIEKGSMRAYKVKEKKSTNVEVSKWFLMEGDMVVSVSSFYDQVPGTEYMQALEDTSAFYIDFDQLEFMYNTFPEVSNIGRILTTKYFVLWNSLLDAMRMTSSKERYEWILKNHPNLLQRVSQSLLAPFLGMTEVSLSKAKRQTGIH